MGVVKKTKVVFLVTQSEMGGAQRYVFEIARLLDKNLFEITVAAGEGDGGLFKKLAGIGIKTVALKKMKRAPWPWQISSAVWEIREILKTEKPGVLFLCSTTAGFLGALANLGLRKRTTVIYRIGGWAFRDPRACWKNWLILALEKFTARLKDLIIVNSEIDRQLALKYKIVPEKRLIKIYNGIDADSLNFLSRDEARSMLHLQHFNEGKIVGTVANFYKTKGLEYLIGAFNKLPAQNLKLVIIGDGRERSKLENLIKKYELNDRVILTGRIPDAYQYLKAFDVFVLPSLKEGFPWIILEAIAAKIPLVTTNVGALPEILDKNFLVKPKDIDGLAKKISRMLESPTMPELKTEFTSKKMLAETLAALRRRLPPTA